MERKIGEIFEFNGEWHQCVKSADYSCNGCDMASYKKCIMPIRFCTQSGRSDKTYAIFKKLEKVGEPFERNGYMYQEYKAHTFPLLMNGDAKIPTDNGFAVIIKQNKEAMKKKKPNMKPFDLEAVKAGKPVCTRDGRKARIICFDAKCSLPIIALITNARGDESLARDKSNGEFINLSESDCDLMMLSEKKEGWVNVYYDNDTSSHRGCRFIYDTKEQAIKSAGEGYITTIKIEWEE